MLILRANSLPFYFTKFCLFQTIYSYIEYIDIPFVERKTFNVASIWRKYLAEKCSQKWIEFSDGR